MVGRWSGLVDQQYSINCHKPSETRYLDPSPSGLGGCCLLLILAWMTAASRVRLENGTASVMHSSTSIANEYVSESVVAWTPKRSMSSGAEYLTKSPDTVFDIVFSAASSMIAAIPKSHICGSPLHLMISLRLAECERRPTSGEIRTFFYAPSADSISRQCGILTHFTVEGIKSCMLINSARLTTPMYNAL